MLNIVHRPIPAAFQQQLMQQGYSAAMARVYAARGIGQSAELDYTLKGLYPYQQMKNIEKMAHRLADAIEHKQHLLVVADYDADGATACAVAVKGLTYLGAHINFIVPNRFEYGYGLTPEIVVLASKQRPDIILTVDNGIADVAGVNIAKQYNIEVLITDHHLPGMQLPDALIVNPNQPGCSFPSKHLAGVGVIFYVLLALRAEMRRRGAFTTKPEPNLAQLLDYVALGTIADVVPLDRNNRTLVEHGLRRIRTGCMAPGIAALFKVAGRAYQKANTFDLGFTLGPRLNAAGRLDDMSVGIACLLANNEALAMQLAHNLDALNRERRHIEQHIQETALARLSNLNPQSSYTLTLYHEDWHQGVVGIVASRLKERYHRPVIVFAAGTEDEIRGSGRSIPGFHLRDALDLVHKRYPGLIQRFGGHAMAAGLSLHRTQFKDFQQAFETIGRTLLAERHLTRTIEVDGSLNTADLNLAFAEQLAAEVWGQGFPVPNFYDRFVIVDQRIVGTKHLKLRLTKEGEAFEAMLFNHDEWLPDTIHAVYQVITNEWQGRKALQIYLQHWVAA